MKFLIDESVGIEVYKKLKRMNFDVISAIELMKGESDEAIIRRAMDEDRVIVTNDKDFGWLASLYKPPGIILLRLRDERAENKVKMIFYVVKRYWEAILGSIMIVSERKIRIRRLK